MTNGRVDETKTTIKQKYQSDEYAISSYLRTERAIRNGMSIRICIDASERETERQRKGVVKKMYPISNGSFSCLHAITLNADLRIGWQ